MRAGGGRGGGGGVSLVWIVLDWFHQRGLVNRLFFFPLHGQIIYVERKLGGTSDDGFSSCITYNK